jgi:hypothetical protein
LLWLEACGLAEEDYRSSRRVCSFHFRKECFHTTYIRKSLKPGSVPTIFTKKDFEDYKNSGKKFVIVVYNLIFSIVIDLL